MDCVSRLAPAKMFEGPHINGKTKKLGVVVLREECWTSENKTQTQVVGGKEDLLR
jgi:hypothetical protein